MPRFLPRLVAWQVVLVCLAATTLPAQALLQLCPPEAVAYSARHWHIGNGLPQNSVNAVAQTMDGHVWVGTFGGLCRLDGERIAVFDIVSGLPSSRVRCLFEASDGTLWIGFDIGGLVSHRDGEFTHHAAVQARQVNAVAEAAVGDLAIATPDGVWRRRGEAFERWPGPPRQRVSAFLRRKSGDLLGATDHGVWQLTIDGSQQLTSTGVLCMAELGDRLLLGSNQGLFCLDAGTLRPWQPVPGCDQAIHALLPSRDGALWIGTAACALRIAAELLPDAAHALPNGNVDQPPFIPDELHAARALLEDRENGIWVGGDLRGISRYAVAAARGFGHEHGLPPRSLHAVLDDGRGGMFVGTGTGLFRRDGNQFVAATDPTLPRSQIPLCADPDGSLWLLTLGRVARLDADGLGPPLDNKVWPTHRVRAMVVTTSGDHWLGGESGLALLRGRELSVPAVAEPFRGRPVRTLALAPDGALWIGEDGGLTRLAADGTARSWTERNGLPRGTIRTVVPENGDLAWAVSYGGGLVRIHGDRCSAIDERHGLHDQHLSGMLLRGDTFTFVGNRGVCTVARDQVEAVLGGRAATIGCRVLDIPGTGSAEISGGQQNCFALIGATLWFCSIERLYAFDLDAAPLGMPPPIVKADDVFFGDRRIRPAPRLDASPGTASLGLRLGSATFEHPERLRFRWRLGDDATPWVGPTYDRDVRLHDLGQGEHRFEAEAIGVDGTPSPRPLRWWIHVPKAWWQTGVARFSLAIGSLAIAALLIRYGARRSANRAARLQALVDVRTRELEGARLQLEQRVAERTEELQVAMRRQQESTEARGQLERQLQQTQRMESLGQLAGGVAHDFNNLLTVILGSADLIAAIDSSTERTELTRAIRAACRRGSNLTQHLLAVASRQSVELTVLDLGRIVADLLPVLRSLLGDSITLVFDPPKQPVVVRAAMTQIEQVLLNLASNAREAMARGGMVTIAIVVGAGRVSLSFTDTGSGMAPEVLEHVFEPFYSTKAQGVGRGLGLATVYGIVKQLSGEVRIDSSVGRGTTVVITLPEESAAPVERTVELPSVRRPNLSLRVLLIEDESLVRSVLERVLAGFGCAVRSAPDGSTGLAMLRSTPDDFDVVLSDVVMPGLHGRDLAHAILGVRAHLPIVFLSGYLDGRLTHQDLESMGLDILPKPVEPNRLAQALQHAVARRRGSAARADQPIAHDFPPR